MVSPVNNLELGRRIKQLRLSQGYTLKDIESKVGVSATHVSEVERGKTSPTVGALSRIAAALDVNPSFLVDLPVGESDSLTRAADRMVIHGPREAARWEILTAENPYAELSLFVLVLEANSDKPLVRPPRPGDKFMYVIRGLVEMEIADEKYHLRQGDSIHFKSSQKLRLWNFAEGESHLFWADWPRMTL